MSPDAPLLEVRGLSVAFRSRHGEVPAVRDVDLVVHPGETVALVGESNKSARTFCPKSGGVISEAGGGLGCGQTGGGNAPLPVLAQLDSASAKASDSAISSSFGIGLVLFMLGRDLMQPLCVAALSLKRSGRVS